MYQHCFNLHQIAVENPHQELEAHSEVESSVAIGEPVRGSWGPSLAVQLKKAPPLKAQAARFPQKPKTSSTDV